MQLSRPSIAPRLFVFGLTVLMFAAQPSAHAQAVLFNEVDANTLGDPDAEEFIELINPSSSRVDLSPLVLVFFNGATDASYRAIDLDGHSIAAGDVFVISGGTVPNTDMVLSPGTRILQNGADAVALYRGSTADFPDDTPVQTANLVDALVYSVADPDDPELLALLNAGEPQVDEEVNGNSAFESMQRCPDGAGGAQNTSTYLVATPTPGTINQCPCGDGAIGAGEDCDDGADNGTLASCCTDTCTFASNTTPCTPSATIAGMCNDPNDRCNGAGVCIDVMRGTDVVCRVAMGDCDVEERCNGLSPTCPLDGFVLDGRECRGSRGDCDPAEHCDGTGRDCPTDERSDASTVCRLGVGLCNPPESCNGVDADCPADQFAMDGADCDPDGMVCDGLSTCTSGVCIGGPAPDCDDDDECTTDMCVEPSGCANTPIPGCCLDNADCDDGDACTSDICNMALRTCSHFDDPTCVDGGAPGLDAGPITSDGGAPTDAGSVTPDGGGPGVDADRPFLDAGTRPPLPIDGGCGCRAASGPSPSAGWMVALLLVGLLRRRYPKG